VWQRVVCLRALEGGGVVVCRHKARAAASADNAHTLQLSKMWQAAWVLTGTPLSCAATARCTVQTEAAALPPQSITQCVCGDVGREVIRLTHSQGNLIQGQGPYLLLTPYTHGVPYMDCEGPCDVTRTNPLLPPGRKALETCPHQESNRVPIVLAVCTAGWLACCSAT
jgi:hypothetical protein